jgi:hypothetical protein
MIRSASTIPTTKISKQRTTDCRPGMLHQKRAPALISLTRGGWQTKQPAKSSGAASPRRSNNNAPWTTPRRDNLLLYAALRANLPRCVSSSSGWVYTRTRVGGSASITPTTTNNPRSSRVSWVMRSLSTPALGFVGRRDGKRREQSARDVRGEGVGGQPKKRGQPLKTP